MQARANSVVYRYLSCDAPSLNENSLPPSLPPTFRSPAVLFHAVTRPRVLAFGKTKTYHNTKKIKTRRGGCAGTRTSSRRRPTWSGSRLWPRRCGGLLSRSRGRLSHRLSQAEQSNGVSQVLGKMGVMSRADSLPNSRLSAMPCRFVADLVCTKKIEQGKRTPRLRGSTPRPTCTLMCDLSILPRDRI